MSTEKRLSLQKMHLAKGARQKWDIIICLSIPQPTVSKCMDMMDIWGKKFGRDCNFSILIPFMGILRSLCV